MFTRLRRLRSASWIRSICAENSLQVTDLILPLFVVEGSNKKEEIKNFPDTFRYSIDNLIRVVKEAKDLGIPAIALFPCLEASCKDLSATEAYNPNNLVCRAIRAIKDPREGLSEIGVIADIALDPYTSHGHDGLLRGEVIDNDATLEILRKQALVNAAAGADIIAPSDMMDGRVKIIRESLDDSEFSHIPILSYTAKYASNFYGAFRQALGSKPGLDKRSYHMDYRNYLEAEREVAVDVAEGTDMIIVKPGMPYLDVMKGLKTKFNLPIIAYQVSSEYAMLKLAAQHELFNYENTMLEVLTSFKRAGCSAIITYGALEIAKFISNRPH